jgi:methylated-DNA-[protein]-cysteine S-methyltransferase
MNKAYLETPLGTAVVEGDEKGISRITVSSEEVPFSSKKVPLPLKEAVAQLQEYFNGERENFKLQLNPEGTDFQKQIWQHLQAIPYGKTTTYLELSKEFGNAKAIRAVAAANGKNPLWIVVPCHRVIGSDGSLTGYAGGLWRKKWLLEHEQPAKQQSLAL